MKTPLLEWSFPEENADPWFDDIHNFYDAIDSSVFGLLNTAANVICPPSIVSWDGITKTLTWNDDFVIPLVKSGFLVKVQYGPDAVTRSATFVSGQRLVVVVPNTSGAEVLANFAVVNAQTAVQVGLYTVGFCYGDRFYANFPQVFI